MRRVLNDYDNKNGISRDNWPMRRSAGSWAAGQQGIVDS